MTLTGSYFRAPSTILPISIEYFNARHLINIILERMTLVKNKNKKNGKNEEIRGRKEKYREKVQKKGKWEI